MRLMLLGLRCNNACVFCAQGELRAQDREPRDAGELRAGEDVAFVGGEPTLDERLPALIAAADARGAARILVQTNGRRLAYRSYVRELAGASRRLALDVSLHGSTEAMHDYHTQAPGSFGQTVIGLRNAREVGIETAVTTVVTRSNYRHLVEIVRLAHALGARAIQLACAQPLGSAARSASRVVPQRDLAQPEIERALAEARRLGLEAIEDARPGERFAGIGEELEMPERANPRVGLKVLPGRSDVVTRARRAG